MSRFNEANIDVTIMMVSIYDLKVKSKFLKRLLEEVRLKSVRIGRKILKRGSEKVCELYSLEPVLELCSFEPECQYSRNMCAKQCKCRMRTQKDESTGSHNRIIKILAGYSYNTLAYLSMDHCLRFTVVCLIILK